MSLQIEAEHENWKLANKECHSFEVWAPDMYWLYIYIWIPAEGSMPRELREWELLNSVSPNARRL